MNDYIVIPINLKNTYINIAVKPDDINNARAGPSELKLNTKNTYKEKKKDEIKTALLTFLHSPILNFLYVVKYKYINPTGKAPYINPPITLLLCLINNPEIAIINPPTIKSNIKLLSIIYIYKSNK